MTQDQPAIKPAHYNSVIDPGLRFDRCTSDTTRPGLLRFLRMAGEGRTPGCSNAQPWWTSIWAFTPLAALLAGRTAGIGWDLIDTVSAVVMLMLIWLLATMTLNPRRRHAVCDLCGLCSVADKVKPGRTNKIARKRLRAAGWTVDPRSGRAHCRGHATVPFIHRTGETS